jgi:hypothetical protein
VEFERVAIKRLVIDYSFHICISIVTPSKRTIWVSEEEELDEDHETTFVDELLSEEELDNHHDVTLVDETHREEPIGKNPDQK